MANPASVFPSAPPKFADNGSGMKLLQPENQVPFTAISDPPTAAQATALRDALVVAGIMRAS